MRLGIWSSSGIFHISSLRRGYIIELFERNGVFEEFKAAYWPYGNAPGGESKRRRSLRIKQQHEDFLAGTNGEADIADEEIEEEESEQAFAAETDLRDFLPRTPVASSPDSASLK